MLDYAGWIFTDVTLFLREKYPKIFTAQDDSTAPPKFPAVTIVQKDTVNYQRTIDSDGKENHVKVMYQIDVYTNGKTDKIQKARDIAADISDHLLGLGFNRTMCQPIPNVSDMSVYRISMRFEGVIAANGIVYTK